VSVNRRLEYLELVGGVWQVRATLALPPGIQQNTGTLFGEALASFGVDTTSSQIVECRMDPDLWMGSCTPIVAAALPPNTNYVGAAVTPAGVRMAWATTVADGGGGSFHWFVDYGGGWNGPRSGGVGGYNDASYVNIAFHGPPREAEFVMHAELVSGLAPSWGFRAAVADGVATSADPVTFALLGATPQGTLATPSDVFVDPATGDTHVLANLLGGGIAYVHRPDGGAYRAPSLALPDAFRARWVLLAGGTLVLVHGRSGAGLFYRTFSPSQREAGALDLAAAVEQGIPLPAGYEDIVAIYPAVSIYQGQPPSDLAVAVVGATRQHEVLYVSIAGL
jgi:hypothetical protein